MTKDTQATHIAIYVPSLRGGGAERVMLTLAEGFAQRGYQVDLVLVRAEGSYLSQVPDAVRIVDLGASRVITSLPGLVCYLRRKKPDVLLSALNHANVVAVYARLLARVATRVTVTEHSTLSIAVKHSFSLRGRWMPWFMRYSYRHADGVVAVSDGVADDLAETIGLDRNRISTIYNPVVTDSLLKKAEEPLEHSWFQPAEPPVVLAVGRLTKPKDFPTLIRAVAAVRHTRQVRLLVLGEGEERATLESLGEKLDMKNVMSLPGFVNNPYQYMKNAAVVVLSSRWEGLSNVLIEAMACGTSVVSTDCPSGPAEILESGKWGTLVPVGDVKQLAAAIGNALLQSDRHKPVKERAQTFSDQAVVDDYLEYFCGQSAQS